MWLCVDLARVCSLWHCTGELTRIPPGGGGESAHSGAGGAAAQCTCGLRRTHVRPHDLRQLPGSISRRCVNSRHPTPPPLLLVALKGHHQYLPQSDSAFFSYSLTFTSLTRFWVCKEDHHQLRTLTSTWLICTPTLPDPNLGPNPNLTSPDLTLSSEG